MEDYFYGRTTQKIPHVRPSRQNHAPVVCAVLAVDAAVGSVTPVGLHLLTVALAESTEKYKVIVS